MARMTYPQLVRQYVKADPLMARDFHAVCVEQGMTSNHIQMVQEVIDLDNDCADPHDADIGVEILRGWLVLISAMRQRNFADRVMLKDLLFDLRMAIDSKNSGE